MQHSLNNHSLNINDDINCKESFVSPKLTVEDLTTALYEVSQTLQRTNQELLRSQQEQLDLLTNISHDLRSPITAANISIEYILDNPGLSEIELNKLHQLILKKLNYMNHLIEDIFLFSSLHTLHSNLHFETHSINKLLKEFYCSCQQDPRYKTCLLVFDVPAYFSYHVNVDTKLIIRLLDNLYTNALKYSDSPQVIQLMGSRFNESFVQICISDNGIGISSQHLDKIFNQSYMVSDSRTPDNSTGNGFGLAIAKSIVTLHGGTIWCESKLNEGSNFYFTLPIIL